MNRTLKYISLVLALLFVVAGCTMIAFAYDGDIAVVAEGEEGGGDPGNGAADPGYVDPGNNGAADPGYVDPGNNGSADPGYVDPGVVDPGNGNANGAGGVDTGAGTGTGTNVDNGSGAGTGAGTGTGSDYYYSNDANQNSAGYSNENNGYDAYGDGVGNEEAAGSVKSNTTLYQSSGISDKEAAPNEWSEITLDEKTVTTGVTDFSSIKTNTNEKAGEWIVYLGYFLIGLSVLGILYFIIATISQRSYDRAVEQRERRRDPAPYEAEDARMEELERRRAQTQAHRTSRYADEAYRSRRVSPRADTGEIYVPRRTRAK